MTKNLSGRCAMAQSPSDVGGLWYSAVIEEVVEQHSALVAAHGSASDEQEEDCPLGHPLPAAQKVHCSRSLYLSRFWSLLVFGMPLVGYRPLVWLGIVDLQ